MTAVVENSPAVFSRPVSEALMAVVQPGSVVLVEQPGGPVSGWLVVEAAAETDESRECAVVALDGSAVLAAGLLTEVRITGDPVPTDEMMPRWASTLAAAFWGNRRARAETAAVRAALQRHEARLDRIVEDAHVYADEHSLCEAFDRFMTDHNLPPRSRDYVCEVDVTVRVRVGVTARNADAAESEVDDDKLLDAIDALGRSGLADAIQDHDVVDVEEN